MQALVIGNGESRRNIDIADFKDHTLIGCNAIHRDLIVDHLICCDQRMAREALENPNIKQTSVYVRNDWYHYFRKVQKHKNINIVPELPYKGDKRHDQPVHWGSGCYALLLAAVLEHRQISMIGFDLYAKEKYVNNVYKDSPNYSRSNASPVDPSYWIYQIGKVFEYFPDIDFLIYNFQSWNMPEDWKKNNVHLVPIGVDSKLNISYNTSTVD